MVAPIGLRDDFDAPALRALAKASRDPDQLRRLPSVAEIYDGGSRGDAARLGGVVRWRLLDLAQWVWEEFRIRISVQTLSRELRALGYRKLSARPRHYAQDRDAMAAFKKSSPPSWQRSPPERLRART